MILKKYIPNTGYPYPVPRIRNKNKNYKLIFKPFVIKKIYS